MKDDAERAELCGARLLGSAGEHVAPPRDRKVLESRRKYHCMKLCFQQSTGDSALPKIDLSFGGFRDLLRYEDIADLEPATWA
jgi:hypothetical protein